MEFDCAGHIMRRIGFCVWTVIIMQMPCEYERFGSAKLLLFGVQVLIYTHTQPNYIRSSLILHAITAAWARSIHAPPPSPRPLLTRPALRPIQPRHLFDGFIENLSMDSSILKSEAPLHCTHWTSIFLFFLLCALVFCFRQILLLFIEVIAHSKHGIIVYWCDMNHPDRVEYHCSHTRIIQSRIIDWRIICATSIVSCVTSVPLSDRQFKATQHKNYTRRHEARARTLTHTMINGCIFVYLHKWLNYRLPFADMNLYCAPLRASARECERSVVCMIGWRRIVF